MAKPPKGVPTKPYDIATAVRTLADQPEMLGVFGISQGLIVGGSIAAADVDAAAARFAAAIRRPGAPPPPAGMDVREQVAATLHNLIPKAAKGEEPIDKAAPWIVDAICYLLVTDPDLDGDLRDRLRVGGVNVWYSATGSRWDVVMTPSGVVPEFVPATLH